MSSIARSARRDRTRRMERSRTIAGASVLAIGSLVSGYMQVLRQAPSAYAAVTCGSNVIDDTTFNAAIVDFNNGYCDTINITASFTLAANPTRIDFTGAFVDDTLTIQGASPTTTVSGGDLYRPISAKLGSGHSLVVSTLTLADGNSAGLTNDVRRRGGAIAVNTYIGENASPQGSVTLSNVKVLSSSALSGTVPTQKGGAGAIFAGGISIANSEFFGNSSNDGGALYLSGASAGDVTITNSTFGSSAQPNVALDAGGAMYVDLASSADKITVTNTTFDSNDAGTSSSSGHGGGAYIDRGRLYLYDSILTSNSADNGGAIYVQNGGTYLLSEGNTFSGNTAGGRGGAVFADTDTTGPSGFRTVLEDDTFINNSSVTKGGALDAYERGSNPMKVTATTFTGNSSSQGRGGAIYVSAPLTMLNSTVTGNSARRGGGIYVYDDTVGLIQTTVSANNSDDTGGGPALGGGIMLGDKLSSTAPVGLRAYRSSIFGNSADDTGGAAYMQRLGYITLTNSYVGSNVSTRNTGGLASANGSITLNFSTIVDNTAQSGSFATDVVAADIDATGSVVANSAPLSVLASNSLDDTSSVFTQSGSGGTGSVWGASLADIALQPRDGSGPGLAGRTPSTSSVLATNAPNSALNTGVTVDQLGTTRGPSWTIGARQASANPNPPTPPAPVYPPSAPRDVTAFPADSSAVVTWREPESSGSFPVSTYRVTSTPGGKSCLAVAPSLTCAVTVLTNGVIYTFTAEALNGAGWGPAGGPSAPIRPGGVTPAPPPEPLPGPLSPGGSVLQVDGAVDPNVTVEPKPSDRGLDVTGDGWTMDLDGLGPDGQPLRLGPDGSLRLASERDVLTSGTGFLPNSDVDLYVDPPVLLQGATARSTRAAEGIYVGTVR
ncbi:MAG: hypothetical protein RL134_2068, partial [Actinomycetota bacterium]